ncbi:ABC transporter permease [Brevibacterium album]|uniref:ABC transporter permease n=1 Tax=Brevibacterium album TaxID=417948 RepID=UPI00041A34EC|nr:ABC transporter permease [Brevibacterium album]
MQAAFLIHRALRGLLVLWLVHLMTFMLIRLVPGDPAEVIAGEQATPEAVDQIRESLGLTEPLPVQYWNALRGVLTGDLGESLFSGLAVTRLLLDAVPPSLSIALGALAFAVMAGVLLGAIAGLTRGRIVDRCVSALAGLGIAMPSFWVGMMLVTIFSITLNWLPATSYAPLARGTGEWASHIVLPAIALGTTVAAEIARHTRGGVIDVMEKPFIRAARARGATGAQLVLRHVLRNTAIPVITVIGLSGGTLLGGTVVVETVFGISGLGNLAISSVLSRDYPVIQGYVLLTALIVVVINLTVDILYGVVNPKVRKR